MSNEDFPESNAPVHPINLASYTLDTIPATEITVEEATFWAQTLQKTHHIEGSVLPIPSILADTDSLSVSHLLNQTEGTQRNRVVSGKTIVGPAVMRGEVIRSGIGFWAPIEDGANEA